MPAPMRPHTQLEVAAAFHSWTSKDETVKALANEVAKRLDQLMTTSERGGQYRHYQQYERDANAKIAKALIPLLRNRPMAANLRQYVTRYGAEAVAQAIAPYVWGTAVSITKYGDREVGDSEAARRVVGIPEDMRLAARPTIGFIHAEEIEDVDLDDDGGDY